MMDKKNEESPFRVLSVDCKERDSVELFAEDSQVEDMKNETIVSNDVNNPTKMDVTVEDKNNAYANSETIKHCKRMEEDCVQTISETCTVTSSVDVLSKEVDKDVERIDDGTSTNTLNTCSESATVGVLIEKVGMEHKLMMSNQIISHIHTTGPSSEIYMNVDFPIDKELGNPVESIIPDVTNSRLKSHKETDENNEVIELNTINSTSNDTNDETKMLTFENNLQINNDDQKLETAIASPLNIPESTVETTSELTKNVYAANSTPIDTSDKKNTSGLGLLVAHYGDDKSDSEDSVIVTTNEYRDMVVEIDSDTSDDSDLEIFDSKGDDLNRLINSAVDDECDEDDDNNGKPRKPPKVKGELLLEDLPPIQDLQITVPEEECIELGKVFSIVDQLVLVKPYPNSILVNLDTVLFLEKGQKVLGEVFDVLGQVADPIYCIRFNSNKQIKDKEIEKDQLVYAAPKTKHTQFIILSNLMNVRGSDASWENDIEPPPKYLDYSDDEEEREARRSVRNKDRPTDYVDLTKKTRSDMPTNSERRRGNVYRQRSYQPGRNFNSRNNLQQQPSASHSWHTSNYCNNNQQFYPPVQNQPFQNMPNMVFNPYSARPPQLNPQNFMPRLPFSSYLNRPPPPAPQ